MDAPQIIHKIRQHVCMVPPAWVDAAIFSVPLTPFNGIILEFDADGLCVPGIRIQMFAQCGAALLYILRKILLLTTSHELMALNTTARNGFQILRHFLNHTVGLLGERANILRPPREDDVFRAAEAWDLYRVMQIHRG